MMSTRIWAQERRLGHCTKRWTNWKLHSCATCGMPSCNISRVWVLHYKRWKLDLCNAVDLVRSLREDVAGLWVSLVQSRHPAKGWWVIWVWVRAIRPQTLMYICVYLCYWLFSFRTGQKIQVIQDVCENFGFLNGLRLISPQDLRSLSLQRKYNSDLWRRWYSS